MEQESNLPLLKEFIRSHDEEWTHNIPQDPKKQEYQHLIVEARQGLERCIGNILKLVDENSIEYQQICDFILDYLRLLEKYRLFYVKTMPDGSTRIFRKTHCRRGPDIWRKCPEYECPGWSADESWECPHKALKITWGK